MIHTGSTLGQQMMGMRYVSTTHKRLLIYYIITVLVPYITTRISTILSLCKVNETTISRVDGWAENMQRMCNLLDLIHFCYFLQCGGYRGLRERICGLQSVHEE